MLRRLKISSGILAFACVLAFPALAQAFDAGLRPPELGDSSPGAVSVPFEIPIRQSAAVPQPLNFEIAVEGFALDPEESADVRIGSLDMITDAGDFDNKAILSNGPASDGVRYWILDWQLSNDPIIATVEDGLGLDANGERVADPASTLIGFTVPGNYHGFRLMGLALRFNQQEKGEPTPGVGAVNPTEPGSYLIRSRIESVAPESEVSVTSTRVRIGLPAPKAKLAVRVNRSRVRPGGRVRFSLRTVNGTHDTVRIWSRGRLLRKIEVGPETRRIYWRPGRKLASHRVRFRFRPANGPDRRLSIRVSHRAAVRRANG